MGKRTVQSKQRRVKVRRRLLVEPLSERRVLAAITGAVFDDANHSFQKEANEENVPRRIVYIDANDNASLDVGESFVVAEDDGTFEFQDLADGSYLLRLFNGTQTQTQTVPVEATIEVGAVSVDSGSQLEVADRVGLTLTADSVVVGDLESGNGQAIAVGNQLSRMQTLPDGTLLVVGTDSSGDTSWIVDPENQSVKPIDLSGSGQSIPWADVAIDANGMGVLLEHAAGMSAIRAVDASEPGSGVQVTTTTSMVPADTQVLTSQSGMRSVFAWGGDNGLELSLWSNESKSFISTNQPVAGTTELLAFDDASGLLAVRTETGGVSVRDVNDTFKPLHTMDEATGPVAIDGARDLLLSISPLDAVLKVVNLTDGELIGDIALDLSSVGQVSSLAMGDSPDSIVVLGATGVLEVALRRPAAQKVTVSGGQDADPVLFGVSLIGSNSSPTYTDVPNFVTNEDKLLSLPASSARTDSTDADGDDYVLVQRGQASNGVAVVRIDGSFSYVPNDDFSGTDSVPVLLHDGRDASAEVMLNIIVNPVPDSPVGVDINIPPIMEDIAPGEVVGDITIIDADGPGHTIVIDDPRFGSRGVNIIFVDGNIDFETEAAIPITVTVTDTETNDVIEEHLIVTVRDANDPITAITPSEGFISENAPGDVVTELRVHDEDPEQFHNFSVDDERFIVEDFELRLVDGVAIDYEAEETIVVKVTATEVGTGGSFTQEITIHVRDLPEQPQTLGLSNASVLELVPGAVVGDVSLDSRAPNGRFALTVDDSRFEVDSDNTLKLVDDQFVERASQTQIEVSITATDSQSVFDPISENFVIDVLENSTPSHNHDNPYDVNHGGDVTAVDALAIINYLNTYGPGPVGEGDLGLCYDVNADGFVTALDALLVINEMRRQQANGGGIVGDGEGEQIAEGDTSEQTSQAPASKFNSAGALNEAGKISDNDSLLHSRSVEYDLGKSKKTHQHYLMSQSDVLAADRIELPTHSSSREFAEKLDETLRLLSEKTS